MAVECAHSVFVCASACVCVRVHVDVCLLPVWSPGVRVVLNILSHWAAHRGMTVPGTRVWHRHTHLLLILTVSCTSSLMLVQLNQEVLIQSTLRSGWGCQNVTLHLKWADEAFGITIFNMMRTLVLPRFTNTEHVCTHLYCLDTSSDKCINSYYEKLMN